MSDFKTVVIADDVPDIRDYLKDIVEEMGLTSVCCATGKELIDVIKNENLSKDLIFLDLSMPEMNGLEILKLIPEYKVKQKFKVCVISGHKEQKIIDKAIELKIDDYISKPFDRDILINRIRNLIGIDKSSIITFAFAAVNFKCKTLNLPAVIEFSLIGLSEEGAIIESPVNFKEQSILSFTCSELHKIANMPKDDYKIKVMKSTLKKDNIYEVTTVFVSMPEFVAQRIRSFAIKNVKT
ncbi:response regulator [Pigmentibacter ruber]|uniref:response regulator n=1 Tax=Pigmentibacter ruber TaxID=2683196 RepID=UPI00131B03F8|nr:response regulator [Pigmentibacter ruber]BFD30555.1 hypothetical protein GTC16762_01730 [Pigmentibacter ruber]